jgi:hypothetical protein
MNNNNYKLFKETLLRMAGEVGLPKNAVANDLGLLKETNNMDNKKLKQLVKEALSNMVEEETETENEVEITVNINGEEQELDEIDVDDLADKDFGEAMSANEMYRPAYDIHDSGDDPTGLPTDSDDHFQNVEEMDMGGGTLDKDAKNLANFLLSLPSDIEDNNFGDELSLREFFDIKEMARVSDTYEGSDEFVRLLQLMNTNIQGPGGRGRKRAPFTSEDLKNIINIVDQGSFTALDISNAIMNTDSNLGQIRQVNKKDLYDLAVQKGFLPSNWDKDTIKDIKNNNPTKYQEIQDLRKDLPGTPQWVNAKLNHIEKGLLSKNYVTRTSELKKSMEPDTSAEPKRRGRPPAPKPPSPEDEFDAPEMEPEMAPDDDPVVQQATQAQAQAQDPKRKAVKDFMDQMKAMGIISDTNKVLDMDTYKDEFAKFKSTMSENNTLNESKNKTMKKQLLTERFQQLAGIKPLYAINSLKEGTIEHEWDGLPEDTKLDIIGDAKSGRADYSDLEKDFATLKSEIPNFESGVANYLGIDEGGGEEKNEIFGFGKNKKSSGGSSDTYDVYGHAGGSAHSLGSGYESEQEAKNKSRSKRRQFQKNFKVDSPAFSITKNNKTVWSI